MKKFAVLFHGCRNVELIKDVGRIPYYLQHLFGYHSKIICYKNDDHYFYLENEARGLEIEFIKKIRIPLLHISPAIYLLNNSRNIDILNLYHFSLETVIYGIIYKTLNSGGTLYIKTDLSVSVFKRYGSQKIYKNRLLRSIEFILRWILQEWLIRLLISISDIVSTETSPALLLLQKRYPNQYRKIIYIPNGTTLTIDTEHSKNIISEKQNIIMTVGRIGAPEKNNRMLLYACTKIHLQNWKVLFAGEITPEFRNEIDRVTKLHPSLENSLVLPGYISDRRILEEYYLKSKVFCLTSNWESFGIVLVEALMAGNFIISTPISSSNDITDFEKYGRIVDFDDNDMLADLLKKIINNEIDCTEYMQDGITYAKNRFYWPSIVNDLQENIETL